MPEPKLIGKVGESGSFCPAKDDDMGFFIMDFEEEGMDMWGLLTVVWNRSF